MGEISGIVVALWLLALAGCDTRTSRLPNPWLVPPLVAVAASGIGQPSVLIAAVAAAAPYVVGFVAGQTGGGDVKLAFVLGGTCIDVVSALAVVLLAQLITVTLHVSSPTSRASPHAPALTCAAVVSWSVGG